jgi:subtilisin-like proprotein convertase family protein
MVTGAVALMLEANPSLALRDIQHIFAETSVKNGLIDSNGDGSLDSINPNAGGDAGNPGNPAGASTLELRDSFSTTMATTPLIADGHNTGWFQNGAGHWVSDSFGFGIVDAGAAVQAANNWTNVSDELKATTNTILSNPFTIPEGNLGDLDSLSQAGSWKVQDPLKVEWVELTLDLNLPEQDEVMLAVQSPSGTRSVLMAPGGSNAAGFNSERTLITNQFWGEPSSGEWSVEVLDIRVDGDNATISDAKLDIYGTCDQQSPLKVTPFDEHAINGFGLDKLADKFLADGGAKSHHYELIEVIPRGKSKSFGTFKSGIASGLKIDQGTIYTTGHSKDAIGPNSRPNTTTNWQAQGTPLLGDNNKDASGFEIRFKAKRDMSLGWKAQFGSEEFDEWSPSIYDDRAGIFLSTISGKKGSQPVNLLRSPDDMDFSVNGFSSKGVFEKRISLNEPCGPVTWEYDGVTGEAIESQKANLVKGKSYSITPIIADMVDPYYDSGMVIGSIKKISKTSSFPDFTSFNKNDFQEFRWKKYDISKLSDKKANSVNWNKVDLNSTSGKTSFDYANANWESIIDSEGFGKQAAKNLSLELLPDRQLSETSINKLLQLNPALKASDFI